MKMLELLVLYSTKCKDLTVNCLVSSSHHKVCLILNAGSYNSVKVSFVILSVCCWLCIMTLHVIFYPAIIIIIITKVMLYFLLALL